MVSGHAFDKAHPITAVIGIGLDELRAKLGVPDVEQRQNDGIWLIFRLPSFDLRVVCTGDEPPIVSSCSASLRIPRATLAGATESLGLWPASRPDEAAETVVAPLVRRSLSDQRGGFLSMTATVRNGSFTQVTVFDEEPEW